MLEVDNETLHLGLKGLVLLGENCFTDKAVENPTTIGQAMALALEYLDAMGPTLELAITLEDSVESLGVFRELVLSGNWGELRKFTKRWTDADYYALYKEVRAQYIF